MQDVWVPAQGQILPDEDQTGAKTFKINVGADLIILCDYIIGNIPKSLSPYLPKLSSLKKVTTPYL